MEVETKCSASSFVGVWGVGVVGVEGYFFLNLFLKVIFLKEIVLTLGRNSIFFGGGKKFLLGDQASEYDCSIFGFMVQFLWQMPETAEEAYMKGKTHSKSFNDNILSSPLEVPIRWRCGGGGGLM